MVALSIDGIGAGRHRGNARDLAHALGHQNADHSDGRILIR